MNVIVVGLGAMGSAAAQHLAERGVHVQGFDRFTPPHAHGSSHGLSRIFRQAYFEDHRYVPLLMRSFELWQRLERDTGERLLHLPGALVVGPISGHLVKRSAESAARFGLPHALLGAKDLKRRYPVFEVTPETHGLLEYNAGYLRPEACVEQQLRQAARAGAQLRFDEPVLDWHVAQNGSGATVFTTGGTYSADHLVITAGPWAPQVLAGLGLPLRVTRQALYWFEPKIGIEAFRADRLPVYLFEEQGDRLLLYGFPLTGPDSEGVKVALHGSEEVCTPESIRREILPGEERAMRERLLATIPSLAGTLLRAETCLYTMAPDEHFLIGAHPHYRSVTIAAGFSGHGFKFAQVIGERVAEMVLSGESAPELEMFSPGRFKALQPIQHIP